MNEHLKIRTNLQDGFLSGNGYYLAVGQVRSSGFFQFALRFTLTQLGVVQILVSQSPGTPTQPGHMSFELTTTNQLRIRMRDHVGSATDFTTTTATLAVGVPTVLALTGGGRVYLQGKLVGAMASQPNDGSSGWVPRYLGRDYLGAVSTVLFHEYVLLGDGLPAKAAQMQLMAEFAIRPFVRQQDIIAAYLFSTAQWNAFKAFPTVMGAGDTCYIGGGLDRTQFLAQQHRFGQASNAGITRAGSRALAVASTLMKDRWFPESVQNELSGLNLMGKLSLFNDVNTFPMLMTTYNVAMFDVRYNKMGGTANATDVAVSNVTIPGRTEGRIGYQTPVGTHDLTWNQDVNMGLVDATSGKYSKLTFLTVNNAVVTVSFLFISNNPLVQTFAQLLDVTKVKVQYLTATGMSTGLTGSLAFSDNAVNYTLATTGLSGTIPPLPATMTRLDITTSALQTPPATYGACPTIALTDNQLNGTHVIAAQTSFILGNTTTGIAGLNYQGTVGTGNIIDLRGSTVDMNSLYINGCRVTQVLMPTTAGRKITVMMMQANPGMGLITWPTWLLVPAGGFFLLSGSPQNQVVPLGLVIAAATIGLSDCSMSEASVNGTLDSFLTPAYNVNYAPFANAKTLSIGGNNAGISNVGDVTRIPRLTAFIKANNWQVTGNFLDYPNNAGIPARIAQRITSFRTPAINPANRIVIIAAMYSNQGAGTNLYITDTTNFNGTWKFISRGNDVEGTNGGGGSNLLLEKVALNFGTPNFPTEVGVAIV